MFNVGDKAKGFKFDGDKYPLIGYADEMDDVVEVVGEVNYVGDSSYSAHFKDSEADWGYPKDLWYLGKVEDDTIPSFKVGDRVKFKKSSIDSGMIDATEDDVFEVSSVFTTGVQLLMGDYFQVFAFCHLEHVKEEIMEEQKIENQAIAWEVGQEVFCLLRGKGVIVYTSHGGDYPIEVEFEEDFEYYTQDGKFFDYHKKRSLFFSEPVVTAELFPPKKPFVPTLKKGDVVLIKSSGFREGVIRTVVEELEDRIIFDEDGNFHMKSQVISVHKIGEEIKFS